MVQLLLCRVQYAFYLSREGHITDMGKKGILPEIVE